MTSSEHEHDSGGSDDDVAASTGLLVLRDGGQDRRAVERLHAILVAHRFRCGPLVGPVIAVTGPHDQVQALADHVEVARVGKRPPGADHELVDALSAVVDSFAWDEGAELD